MYGWTIFILGILAIVLGARAQQPWIVPVVAVCWWITLYRSTKRAKEKRIILKRLNALEENRTSP